MSNVVLQSEEVEVQQTISCLQVAKPNCEPTLNETSEFLWGKISMQIILPENTHSGSTEHWEDDELRQIMKMFGLPTIVGRPDITALQTDASLVETEQIPCPPVLQGMFEFFVDSFVLRANPSFELHAIHCTEAKIGTDKVRFSGKAELRNPQTQEVRMINLFTTIDATAIAINTAVLLEMIRTRSDGNVIGQHRDAPPLAEPSPILAPAEPARSWINPVMNEIEGGKYFDPNPDNFIQQVRKYTNDIRNGDGSDWAFTVFIVDASSDEDGMFADGATAWSEIGGPFMVLSNRLGGYGFDNFDKIFIHEFLHQFYALDEYQGSFDQNTVSGYLGIRNENHEDATGGPFTGDPSIMKRLQIVLSPSDFITDRSPACPGHWTTDPHCEVLVNGNMIGATMDVTPPSCQSNRALTRGCFEVDWNNTQNFNGPAPFFWFHSIIVGPQEPLKPGETYRFGRYYLVNPIGTTLPLGRAAIEVYTDSGTLIASRDLHRTTQFDTNGNAIFEFQSVEFTIPNGTNRLDIFFTRCFADPNQSCSIVAYDDFTLIGDWVFRNEIDDFALKMLGFSDDDGDGLIDPLDTAPDLRIDNFGPQPIALQAIVDDLNTCSVAISGVVYFFSHWEAEDVNLSHSLGGDCGSRVNVIGLIIGPNPTVTPVFEGPAPCPPPCLPPTPQSTEDLEDMEINNSFDVGNTAQGITTPAFLKIRAFDVTNNVDINGVRVKVFPPDLTGATDGITPFTRIYAVGYSIGVPITGHAFDVPRQNMNPIGSGNSVTINDITNVQYCVHEASTCNWLDANPSDGVFDQAGESFNFIPTVRPGLNTITVRTNNTVGNISNLLTTNLLVLPSECLGKTFAKVIVGTEQNDILLGMSKADLILGLEGNDEIRGKAAADCLIGGDGNDIIYGNRGADAMFGAEGDDMLLGGAGNDKLNGGDDFDTCKGGAGTNTKSNCEA